MTTCTKPAAETLFEMAEPAVIEPQQTIDLPVLQDIQKPPTPAITSSLSALAGCLREIETVAPPPPKPVKQRKPKMHARPQRGFD